MDPLFLLWGKTAQNRDGQPVPPADANLFHPLIFHMIDTAEMARAIWRHSLGSALRARWAEAWSLSDQHMESVIACLAGAHDLGKASPPFQSQWAPGHRALLDAGLSFPKLCDPSSAETHGVITDATLPGILVSSGVAEGAARSLAFSVGGHHGTLTTPGCLASAETQTGDQGWKDLRKRLFAELVEVEDAGSQLRALGRIEEVPTWTLMCLAGLTSVADWIASDQTLFRCKAHIGEEPPHDARAYREQAASLARQAIHQLVWGMPDATASRHDFTELFPFSPNRLQQEAGRLAQGLSMPALFVIEAPMGQGKTEAALYAAQQLGGGDEPRGLYFALPTEATSNQMFRRLVQYLARAYPKHPVNIQLLHGHASLSAELEQLRSRSEALLHPASVGPDQPSAPNAPANVLASEWFLPRKRGLLAPFGVGTVDQALLAVLRTRHFFVRLFGLAGKTLIIDEVHAYDAYMITLLNSLLEWLAQMGTSVILLSATLPARRRQELIQAFAKGCGVQNPRTGAAPTGSYPRITWLSRGGPAQAVSLQSAPSASYTLRLRWLDEGDDPGGLDRLGQRLRTALDQGGCAAVICNTVAKAQKVYQALEPYFPTADAGDGAPELDLFHAQFPLRERQRREERALSRFGKVGGAGVRRPRRAVLVATQVVEQSLDLDFDLMVTQLAPADLVLQRAGRMWRHATTPRPPSIQALQDRELWLWTGAPAADGAPAFFPGDLAVYDEYILLLSWLALRTKERWRVPEDIDTLIEAVYGDIVPFADIPANLRPRLQRARLNMEKKIASHRSIASKNAVKVPAEPWELFQGDNNLAEPTDDNADLNPALQALTRIGPLSITVILLQKDAAGTWFIPGEQVRLDLRQDPDRKMVERLLGWSVRISHPGVTHALAGLEVPPAWKRSPHLRGCRLLALNEDGVGRAGDWQVRLDPLLGVVLERANT